MEISPQKTKYAFASKEFVIASCVVIMTFVFNFTSLELPLPLIELIHNLNWEEWDQAAYMLVIAVLRYYFTGSKIIGLFNPESKLGKVVQALNIAASTEAPKK